MDTLDILCRSYTDWCKTIYDYVYLVENNKLLDQYRVICSEYKCVMEIEFGHYLIVLSGTIDGIVKAANN